MGKPRFHDPRDATVDWLMEAEDPAVRYLTMTRLLGLSQRDSDVRRVRSAIMESGVVSALLDRQAPAGLWDDPERFYTAKYRGTAWQLIVLAEHYATGRDPRVRRACEFMLTASQDPTSGGFSMRRSKKSGAGGLPSGVIPCLTGNMVWSLLRLGYHSDERVQRGVRWLTRYLRFDDGESEPPEGWPYRSWEMCYGRHSCLMGVVKGLKALAEIPRRQQTAEVRSTIAEGAEFLLRHHLFKRSHDLARVAKPGLTRLGFPRMYQTDVLEMALIMQALGYQDERLREARELVSSRRGPDGRWRLQDTFNGKFQVDVEQKGEPSRWITARALCLLRDGGSKAELTE